MGEEVFHYDPEHYMIYTVDLPLIFQVEEATEERPYLGFQLDLEPALVASVITESGKYLAFCRESDSQCGDHDPRSRVQYAYIEDPKVAHTIPCNPKSTTA